MERNEIIERIDALRREAGITHDELAAIVYEARDKQLRKIRNEHQEKFIIFSFPDCIMIHEIKGRTVSEMVKTWPETLRGIIHDHERKDGKLGMMVNTNIPSEWATFPMKR